MRVRLRLDAGMVGATLSCGLLLQACAGWTDHKAAAAVTGGLRALERQDNRELLQRLLTSQEVRASTEALARAALDAAWEDLSREERRAHAKELAAELIDATGPALGRVLDRDVLPRVREEVAASLESAMERAFTEKNRRKVEEFAGGVAHATLEGARDEIARAIQTGLAAGIESGVERTLNGRIGPALHQALAGSAPAFAKAMRTTSEAAFLGAADALNGELGAVMRTERQAFLRELQTVAAIERQAWIEQLTKQVESTEKRWKNWFITLAVGAGLILLAGGIWLTLLFRENRRLKAA
jgi:microcompartment protein CcmL/EutN